VRRFALICLGLSLAVIAGYAGFQIASLNHEATEAVVTTIDVPMEEGTVIGDKRPQFSLPDMNGKMRSVDEWDGDVIVINFWATWCPPCREEIPEFIKLQKLYGENGLQFIGIALQTAEEVDEFVKVMGINYPILVGHGEVIQVAKQYGNHVGALPYTVIIDRQSHIAFTKRGPLQRHTAEQVISSLL